MTTYQYILFLLITLDNIDLMYYESEAYCVNTKQKQTLHFYGRTVRILFAYFAFYLWVLHNKPRFR